MLFTAIKNTVRICAHNKLCALYIQLCTQQGHFELQWVIAHCSSFCCFKFKHAYDTLGMIYNYCAHVLCTQEYVVNIITTGHDRKVSEKTEIDTLH